MEIFQSKKFQASLVGVIVAIVGKAGYDLDEQAVLTIMSPILAYIGGQAVADIGKEKAKAEAAKPKPRK